MLHAFWCMHKRIAIVCIFTFAHANEWTAEMKHINIFHSCIYTRQPFQIKPPWTFRNNPVSFEATWLSYNKIHCFVLIEFLWFLLDTEDSPSCSPTLIDGNVFESNLHSIQVGGLNRHIPMPQSNEDMNLSKCILEQFQTLLLFM